MHFGATLRLLRLDAGLSLRQLAAEIGVSSAYLSRVENGHDQAPTPDRLVAIAHALEVQPTLLLELADRVGPFVSSYLESVPAANALFLEIARRGLTPSQLAQIQSFIDREFPAAAPQGERSSLRLTRLLAPERVILGLSCAHLGDAIDLSSALFASSRRDAPRIARAIRAREDEAVTALGSGIGAPHAILSDTRHQAALVTFARPLEYPTPDGAPIRALIVLLLDGSGKRQLELLGQVAKLASADLVDRLCTATSPAEALRLIDSHLP